MGKSYLLASVLRDVKGSLKDSLVINIDGSNPKLLVDFAAVIDHQLAPYPLPGLGNPKYDYFGQTRSLLRALNRLRKDVDRELDHQHIAEKIKKVAKGIYRLGPLLSKIPRAGRLIDMLVRSMEALGVEEHLEAAHVKAALETLEDLPVLKSSGGFLFYKQKKETLRRDPYNALADAYSRDLHATISHYRLKDVARFTPGKIKSLNRLILIVDDFETTGKVLGDFIVESLLRQFENSRFPVLAIFLGRGNIADAHPGFHQHFANAIVGKISLEPFDPKDGVRYLQGAGYSGDEAQAIYGKCGGYPLWLSFFAEHRWNKEQQSAVYYKRFFERTARWMTELERNWLMHLCYLDIVNQATVAAMLPGVNATVVLDWFTEEESVRDVAAKHYVVQPFIREMLLGYHKKLIGSKERAMLEERARAAMEAA